MIDYELFAKIRHLKEHEGLTALLGCENLSLFDDFLIDTQGNILFHFFTHQKFYT